jgi:hypothetical protein
MLQKLHAIFTYLDKCLDKCLSWFSDQIGHALFALIVAGILGVLVVTDIVDKIVAVYLFVVWLAAFIWISRSQLIKKIPSPEYRVIMILLVAVVLVWPNYKFGNWAIEQYRQKHLVGKSKESSPTAPTYVPTPSLPPSSRIKPPTGKEKKPSQESFKKPNLYELFNKEFNTLLRSEEHRNLRLKKPDGKTETVTISEKEYLDFQGKSKFLSYYIPTSDYAYEICEYLPDLYKTTMKDMESKSEVRGGIAQDSSLTSSKDLIFTGRIYIYYEDIFSSHQLAQLELLYESKGLAVIFRGHTYLSNVYNKMKIMELENKH